MHSYKDLSTTFVNMHTRVNQIRWKTSMMKENYSNNNYHTKNYLLNFDTGKIISFQDNYICSRSLYQQFVLLND